MNTLSAFSMMITLHWGRIMHSKIFFPQASTNYFSFLKKIIDFLLTFLYTLNVR